MAPNVINRETVRDQLATLLAAALVGAGKPAEAVYNHQVGDFTGKSPAVVVTSAGTGRGSSLVSNNTQFALEVHTFVLYALENGSWTEAQSEDRLDLLEKMIADVVVKANDSDTWQSVEFNGQSEIDGVEIGGDEYRHEVIPILITAWDY
jgi:hypothetical protein